MHAAAERLARAAPASMSSPRDVPARPRAGRGAIEPPISPRPITLARRALTTPELVTRARHPADRIERIGASSVSCGASRTSARCSARGTSSLGERSSAPGARRARRRSLERADPGAHEAGHGVADGLAHPPDLAVAALVDRDPQHARARLRHLRRRRSGRRRARRRRAGAASAPGLTGPPSTVARYSLSTPWRGVGDAVGQLAVVGQQQQALGVGVEPADREHPRLGRHELDDGRPAVGVLGRRDDAGAACSAGSGRGPGFDADRRAVDLDEVGVGVDPPAEHGDLAVDRHPAGGDQVLADPPAAPAAARRAPSAGARRCGSCAGRRSAAPRAAAQARTVGIGDPQARPRAPRPRRRRG